MRFTGKKLNGLFAHDTPTKWRDYLAGLPEDTKLVIDIDKAKNKRSLSQNAFYWLYLGVIENETGNTAQDLHELFRRKFLKPTIKTILGKEYTLPSSTTSLSKHEFTEYLDKICAEVEIPIPDPSLAGFQSNNTGYLGAEPLKNYPDTYQEPKL